MTIKQALSSRIAVGLIMVFLFLGAPVAAFAECEDFDVAAIGDRDINNRKNDLNFYLLEQDVRLGEHMTQELAARTRFLDDEIIHKYITELGDEVVKNSDARTTFQFRVIDSTEINLFAFPGGNIFICMGMLEEVDTEAELVGLLAHEISHVTARHGTEELSRKMGIKKFIDNIPLFGLIPTGELRQKAIGLSIDASVLGITIDNEKESDCLATQYSWKTGYSPDGFLKFYARVKQKYDLRGEKQFASFLNTHPFYEGKLERLEMICRSLPPQKKYISSSDAFLTMKDQLIAIDQRRRILHTTSFAEYNIAERFAPVFYQEIHGRDNADYFTKFDFDNDWTGDNNWNNLPGYRDTLQAYVYFSVLETREHYYIVYLLYYPRDWKSGGSVITNVRKGFKKALNTVSGEAELSDIMHRIKHSHENDLEGCLVIAQKNGNDPALAVIVAVETFAENGFEKYRCKPYFGEQKLKLDYIPTRNLTHPMLYVETRSHDVRGITHTVNLDAMPCVTFEYGEPAVAGKLKPGDTRTYGLIPVFETFWQKAHEPHGNPTIGKYYKFKNFTIKQYLPESGTQQTVTVTPGTIGVSLKGVKYGINLAQFPWIWEDYKDLRVERGAWFFDPANTVRIHYQLDADFPVSYIHHPFAGIRKPEYVE